MEQWKDIVGYEGYYMVSDRGRIRTLHGKRPKLMKLLKGAAGYRFVDLKLKGTRKHMLTHRAVAMAFLGEQDGKIVHHRNGKRHDNRLENLEWVTWKENQAPERKKNGKKQGHQP